MKQARFVARGVLFLGRALGVMLVVAALISECAKAAPYTPSATSGVKIAIQNRVDPGPGAVPAGKKLRLP